MSISTAIDYTSVNIAEDFAADLTRKFIEKGLTFDIRRGRKFDKIAVSQHNRNSVYAFVEKATGNVIKAATWMAPQKDIHGNLAVRYNLSTQEGYEEALRNADLYGGFLYADYVKN